VPPKQTSTAPQGSTATAQQSQQTSTGPQPEITTSAPLLGDNAAASFTAFAQTAAAPQGGNAASSQSTASASPSNTQAMAGNQTGASAMSNTSIGGNPGLHSSVDTVGEVGSSGKSSVTSDSLSDSQLAAAASMNAAVGTQPTGISSATPGVEEIAQPHVDGEKIEAMMKSVTKELGMRDLSQLKLGGEMTLKLDQGALPNTEVKVRFEGNEMVISIDSKTTDVNQFCTDNLSLLQQSVSSGMKEEMKVRIEVRNPPPDQPNQRKEGQGSGGQGGGQGSGSQGGSSGNSQQQSQNSEGDSLSN
jgi:hypothetical protein